MPAASKKTEMAITEAEVQQQEVRRENTKHGVRLEPLFARENGSWQVAQVASLRNPRHRNFVVAQVVADRPIAFHGWGVSGVAKRVDVLSEHHAFWLYKEGRPTGAKIPLLEPPQYAVSHIDWEQVHPDFRYLECPHKLRELWEDVVPFHIIFPYRQDTMSLSDAVITPAFDPDVAPNTPVPTICVFWVEDPALKQFIKTVKHLDGHAQIGVSSLNDSKEAPPYNTPDLVEYLKRKKIEFYRVIVEDPLLEALPIASSHSQFVIPLKGEEPVWRTKRKGSLSPEAFSGLTGFDIDKESALTARVASRRADPAVDLDPVTFEAARRIRDWYHREIFRSIFHI